MLYLIQGNLYRLPSAKIIIKNPKESEGSFLFKINILDESNGFINF